MSEESGIKITHTINKKARWFGEETKSESVCVTYQYTVRNGSRWFLFDNPHHIWEAFSSFTAMVQWMTAEIRRQGVLFRRY